MRQLIIFLGLIIVCTTGFSQTYNSATGTPSNKPYAPSQATPTDSRMYFYDGTNFLWRQYQSTAEVITYLNQPRYRTGQFPIFLHVGGTLNGDGTFTGGYTREYWFKNNTSDTGLVVKDSVIYPLIYSPYYGTKTLDTSGWHSTNYSNTLYQPRGVVTGLVQQGNTGITVTGSGTTGSPYIVNADTTNKISTVNGVRDSFRLALTNISLIARIEFVQSGSTATYQNDDLIGKQLISCSTEGYTLGFTARTSAYMSFNSTTGTITINNGVFADDDLVVILYRTNPIFLTDGNGNFIKDGNNYIILN